MRAQEQLHGTWTLDVRRLWALFEGCLDIDITKTVVLALIEYMWALRWLPGQQTC